MSSVPDMPYRLILRKLQLPGSYHTLTNGNQVHKLSVLQKKKKNVGAFSISFLWSKLNEFTETENHGMSRLHYITSYQSDINFDI